MERYCFDSDILIQAKNGPYRFQTWPTVWTWLEAEIRSGRLFSSTMVYDELTAGGDELSTWVKNNSEAFIEPDKLVQEQYQKIANHIMNTAYRDSKDFLAGADAWVISHAICENASVVTQEKKVAKNSKKAKIPNVCFHFDVECVDLYDYFQKRGASF